MVITEQNSEISVVFTKYLFVLAVSSHVFSVASVNGLDCSRKGEICVENSRKTCEDCVHSHPCCTWCYQTDFNNHRCNTRENLVRDNCPLDKIYLTGSSNVIRNLSMNKTFQNAKEEKNQPAVQIKPQKLKLQLRLNEPLTFQLQYKAAEDYPLDLYYLMDLTYSMRNDVTTMINLGSTLPSFLRRLSKTSKIAFGYYSDKVAMPFSSMTPKALENPCSLRGETCAMGFDFIHMLNFTKNTDEFIRKVNASKTTGNLDDLEGGTDAIMQIMLCNKVINWRKFSRKIIVIATDGYLHFAGDGILVGATKRNMDICLIDKNGVYDSNSLIYDYPSLEEIYRTMAKNKVNLLFAAKEISFPYYQKLMHVVPDSTYVEKLAGISENVLELVNASYTKVVRNVKFSTNISDHIKVTFQSTCNKKEFETLMNFTNTCDNIEIGSVYTFLVTLELTRLPYQDYDTFVIEELNIAEDVVLDVKYVDKNCSCKEASTIVCSHGNYNCGKCNCNSGWAGELCSIECNAYDSCRERNETYVSPTCYAHGECDYKTCLCVCDDNYSGEYCEYKQCPRNKKTGEPCGGINYGTCIKGICLCEPEYIGEDCSCQLSNSTCVPPGQDDTICHSVGQCVCGKCTCPAGYWGEYCENCSNCTQSCGDYEPCIRDTVDGKNDRCQSEDGTKYILTKVDTEALTVPCLYRRTEEDGRTCDVEYTYEYKGRETHLKYLEKECRAQLAAGLFIGPIIAAILAVGIAAILIYKCRLMQLDRLEYQKFNQNVEENTQWARESNPMFRQATTVVTNPLYESGK